MTAAATVGRSFSLRVLEQLEPQPDVVLEAIEEAEQVHVVAPEPAGREPRYRFFVKDAFVISGDFAFWVVWR